jgi:hypothetical protein
MNPKPIKSTFFICLLLFSLYPQQIRTSSIDLDQPTTPQIITISSIITSFCLLLCVACGLRYIFVKLKSKNQRNPQLKSSDKKESTMIDKYRTATETEIEIDKYRTASEEALTHINQLSNQSDNKYKNNISTILFDNTNQEKVKNNNDTNSIDIKTSYFNTIEADQNVVFDIYPQKEAGSIQINFPFEGPKPCVRIQLIENKLKVEADCPINIRLGLVEKVLSGDNQEIIPDPIMLKLLGSASYNFHQTLSIQDCVFAKGETVCTITDACITGTYLAYDQAKITLHSLNGEYNIRCFGREKPTNNNKIIEFTGYSDNISWSWTGLRQGNFSEDSLVKDETDKKCTELFESESYILFQYNSQDFEQYFSENKDAFAFKKEIELPLFNAIEASKEVTVSIFPLMPAGKIEFLVTKLQERPNIYIQRIKNRLKIESDKPVQIVFGLREDKIDSDKKRIFQTYGAATYNFHEPSEDFMLVADEKSQCIVTSQLVTGTYTAKDNANIILKSVVTDKKKDRGYRCHCDLNDLKALYLPNGIKEGYKITRSPDLQSRNEIKDYNAFTQDKVHKD